MKKKPTHTPWSSSGPSPPEDPFDAWLRAVRTLIVKPIYELLKQIWELCRQRISGHQHGRQPRRTRPGDKTRP